MIEGETVTLTCMQDYRLSGPASTTCTSLGYIQQPLGTESNTSTASFGYIRVATLYSYKLGLFLGSNQG